MQIGVKCAEIVNVLLSDILSSNGTTRDNFLFMYLKVLVGAAEVSTLPSSYQSQYICLVALFLMLLPCSIVSLCILSFKFNVVVYTGFECVCIMSFICLCIQRCWL